MDAAGKDVTQDFYSIFIKFEQNIQDETILHAFLSMNFMCCMKIKNQKGMHLSSTLELPKYKKLKIGVVEGHDGKSSIKKYKPGNFFERFRSFKFLLIGSYRFRKIMHMM